MFKLDNATASMIAAKINDKKIVKAYATAGCGDNYSKCGAGCTGKGY